MAKKTETISQELKEIEKESITTIVIPIKNSSNNNI